MFVARFRYLKFFKFVILLFLLQTNSSNGQSDATSNQFLKDLNSQLLEQKKALDPFGGKKVEIDIESLGLDNVNEASKKQLNSKEEVSKNKKVVDSKITNDNGPPKVEFLNAEENKDLKDDEDNAKEVKDNQDNSVKKIITEEKKPENDQEGILGSIKKIVNKIIESDIVESTLDITNKLPLGKKESTKSEPKEIKAKENVKSQEEIFEEEMEVLRQKYVYPLQDGDEYQDLKASYARPQKKDLNHYIKDEAPALPILSRFRTNDNLHIPVIPTPQERINHLFSTIDKQNVRYFNSSYKYVQNPNAYNIYGETLLTYAIQRRNYQILASILARGADPNLSNKLGHSPAAIAIEIKDFMAFQMLFENGANLNFRDKFGRNYLMYAARVGFLPAVEYLIDKGIDINSRDDDGFTPLAIANKNNRQLVIKYLVKNGAKAWSPDDQQNNVNQISIMRELQNRWQGR